MKGDEKMRIVIYIGIYILIGAVYMTFIGRLMNDKRIQAGVGDSLNKAFNEKIYTEQNPCTVSYGEAVVGVLTWPIGVVITLVLFMVIDILGIFKK